MKSAILTEAIHNACQIGNLSELESLLNQHPELIDERDPTLGWAPLYRTIVCGHIELSLILLQKGAISSIQNRLGETPLHHTAQNNELKLTKILLAFKACPNIAQNDGETPLHLAILKGHFRIVKLLLNHSADPNMKNPLFGKTPLEYAIESEHYEICQLLLENEADERGLESKEMKCSEEIKNLLAEYRDLETNEEVETIISPRSFVTNPSFDNLNKGILSECETGNPTAIETVCSSFEKGSPLYRWLMSHGLEEVFEPLERNGFDDLRILLDTFEESPLSMKTLKKIGIEKFGLRFRLFSLLKNRRKSKNRFVREPVENWLEAIGLNKLIPNFEDAGFTNLEELIEVMESPFVFTDKSLAKELMVDRRADREKILKELREELVGKKRLNLESNCAEQACDFCVIM